MTELSIVIPTWNEADNLAFLLPALRGQVAALGVDAEILVVDAGSRDGTAAVCRENGARLLDVGRRGYGRALRAGLGAARGASVLTMDADLSHPAEVVRTLWERRAQADLLVASRFVAGGSAAMPWRRLLLSRILNETFARALQIPIRDFSSGFRLYRRAVLTEISTAGRNFDVLPEILVRAHSRGFRILEIPFSYASRRHGSSHIRLLAFGWSSFVTFSRMWRLRNSIDSGDYDARAYDSRIPVQRWWQRRRYRIVTGWAAGRGAVLDVGCGSSPILGALASGSVGIDPDTGKLRHGRRYAVALAAGALPDLPIRSGAFNTVICSQVIEHLPPGARPLPELNRVLAPGGRLILGTPDYGRLRWRLIERLYGLLVPGGYATTHVTHYTREGLSRELAAAGFRVDGQRYVGGGELILLCTKIGRQHGAGD